MKKNLLQEIWDKFNEELYSDELKLKYLAEKLGWLAFYSDRNMSYEQLKNEIICIIKNREQKTGLKVKRDLIQHKFDAIYLSDSNVITLSVVNLNIKSHKCYTIITLSNFGSLH